MLKSHVQVECEDIVIHRGEEEREKEDPWKEKKVCEKKEVVRTVNKGPMGGKVFKSSPRKISVSSF
jgi:hypothetical protein